MVKRKMVQLRKINDKPKEEDRKVGERIGEFSPLKKKGMFDLKYYYDKFKFKIKPNDCYLIHMELRNGMHDIFYIYTKKEDFEYKGGTYIIDDEQKYYMSRLNRYGLNYHQDFALPFKNKFPLNDVRKTIAALDEEVETAFNPSSLKQFIEAKVVQGLMKGQQLEEWFKQIKMIAAVAALSSVIHLIIFVVKSGMLNSIKSPF